MRQTDFSGKQFRDDSDPESKDEEDIGYADLVAARKLVRLATDLVHVETDREHDRGQTEHDH